MPPLTVDLDKLADLLGRFLVDEGLNSNGRYAVQCARRAVAELAILRDKVAELEADRH
jgi:hypothetical protein